MVKKLNEEQINKIFEQMLEEEFNSKINQNKKKQTIIEMLKQGEPLQIISQKTNTPINQIITYYQDYINNSLNSKSFTKNKH